MRRYRSTFALCLCFMNIVVGAISGADNLLYAFAAAYLVIFALEPARDAQHPTGERGESGGAK